MRQQLASRAEDAAVAVEDELVLPADRVDVGDEGAVVGRALGDHPLALDSLGRVVGRAVDVDQQLRAVLRLPRHRAGGIPAVLAHGEADANAVLLEDRALVAYREVALLVEDAVVRQENLVIDRLDLAVADERGRVEDLTLLIDEADDRRDAARRGDDRFELLEVVAHEGGLQDEVFRRIAGEGELGEAHDVGLRFARLVDAADDESRVAGQVADDGVDLGQGHPQDAVHDPNSACSRELPVVSFFDRLRALAKERRSQVCIGLDPDPERIDGGAAGALRHCREVARQTEEYTICFKPNSAFWEQYGPDGWKALLELHEEFAQTPFLFDAKRGDMGNTMKAYATAAFNTLAMDAATIHAYMGSDSIQEFTRYEDRGVYVVCRSSNPGAEDLQHLESGGRPIFLHVAELAGRMNDHDNVGLVVGATAPEAVADVRKHSKLPFLIPGVGA